jgi:hypothetical protein
MCLSSMKSTGNPWTWYKCPQFVSVDIYKQPMKSTGNPSTMIQICPQFCRQYINSNEIYWKPMNNDIYISIQKSTTKLSFFCSQNFCTYTYLCV